MPFIVLLFRQRRGRESLPDAIHNVLIVVLREDSAFIVSSLPANMDLPYPWSVQAPLFEGEVETKDEGESKILELDRIVW